MSKCNDVLKTGSGARDARRWQSITATAAGQGSNSLQGAVLEVECSPAAVRQNTILSASAHGPVTGSGVPEGQRRLTISTPAAGHVRFTLPGAVDEEWSPEAVRQKTILSTSARGPVTGSGVRDGQQRLISTPAAGHVRLTLPGTIDEELSPEVDRQSNILSMSTHGGVTGSGARDVRRKSNVSTPAASHIKFALPGAVEEEEEWSPAAIRQNTILSESARGLVTSGGARDVQRRLNISTPAAGQERIAPPRADERRGAEKQKTQRKKKGIRAYIRRKWQDVKRFCCICENEDEVEPTDPADPQQGPSDLPTSARKDDWQNPSGLKPVGCYKPGCCPPGLNTLKKTKLQEETDPNQGPFDPAELRAQPDQTDCKPGPFGLHGAREQNSPFGLERASHEEPAYCLAGSFTLEKTKIQEETDPNQGPFDPAELRAQPDQTFYQSGPFGLHGAREQNSPFGLEQASHKEPAYCQAGSFSLEKKDIQEETDLKHGPFDLEPQAQSDQTYCQPGPSGLQSSGHKDKHTARAFQRLYTVKQQIGQGGFGKVYEATRKSDGRKVAIKFIEKSELFDSFIEMRGYPEPLYAEVAINLMLLKPEKSPYIVEMLDWFEEEHQYIIVLEFPHPCMDLFEFVERNGGRLTEGMARHLMRQAVLAFMHCVYSGVYHGDLKLNNILVNTDSMDLKLIDFGVSELVRCFGSSYRSGLRFVMAEMVAELGFLLNLMLHGPRLLGGINTASNAVISKVEVNRLFASYGVEASRRRLSRRNRSARPRWSFTRVLCCLSSLTQRVTPTKFEREEQEAAGL